MAREIALRGERDVTPPPGRPREAARNELIGPRRGAAAKLIGATAHYAMADLDEGPIIEQDVERVRIGQSAQELERIGSDIERVVLARAVQWHLADRVFEHENRTILLG